MSDFPLPTIHMNGSDKGSLFHEYMQARNQLRALTVAFNNIEFHARDYYVQDGGAFFRAQTKRQEMWQHLGDLQEYLDAHLLHIDNQ